MTISTLIRYFLGNREAILKIGSTPGALWLGMAFVFSAALAREYDGADLMHEPWHLVLPLGASLVTSLLLFCLVFMAAQGRGVQHTSFWSGYRPFLTLYWMTAPLAWLYAIPVERFLSPGDATTANLYLLGIVALWRVVLMIRVVQVVFGASVVAAIFPVMFFADTVALVALFLTPLPIIQFMGGIRHTESENAIHGAAFLIGIVGGVTWLIWLFGFAIVFGKTRPAWSNNLADRPSSAVQKDAKLLAAISLAGWLLVLPFTQGEQMMKWRAERLLRSGRIAEALAFMSTGNRDAFPPHWEIPPRLGYGERQPSLIDVMELSLDDEPAEWVYAAFFDNFLNFLGDYLQRRMDGYNPDSDAELAESRRIARILEQLSQADRIRFVEYMQQQTRGPLSALSDQHSTALVRALHKLFPDEVKNRVAAQSTPDEGVEATTQATDSEFQPE